LPAASHLDAESMSERLEIQYRQSKKNGAAGNTRSCGQEPRPTCTCVLRFFCLARAILAPSLDLAFAADSSAFRQWPLLRLDDRRSGRRPKHVRRFHRWRICSNFGGWRFEIHTPSKKQQRQRRAHIKKVLKSSIGLMLRSLKNAIGVCVNTVDRQVRPI